MRRGGAVALPPGLWPKPGIPAAGPLTKAVFCDRNQTATTTLLVDPEDLVLTIIYRSDAISTLPLSALTELCADSARENQRLGITGFLVEYRGVFLQVLEGEEEVVDGLYARIAKDPRHHAVTPLIRESALRRNFGFWAMNLGPLNDPSLWDAVLGRPMDGAEFRRRSYDAAFAIDVLTRSYVHACVAADGSHGRRATVQDTRQPAEDAQPTS